MTKSKTPRSDQPHAWPDVALYGGSALVAGGVWLFAGIPIQRTWGRLAVGPYAAGAVIALLLGLLGLASIRARVWLALAVMLGVAIVPMALEIAWRARAAPGLHAQSEVIVTEEAARAFVHGKDPYAVDYLHGPLSARPLGTKTHFPYLPAMVAFGLPRALLGSGPWGDARIGFAVATLVLVGWSIQLWRRRAPPWRDRPEHLRPDGDSALGLLQVTLLLPTSALLMATGGDDLPVLGLLLLAVMLAGRGRPVWAGLAAGLAAAAKQTAWPVVPFLLLAARDDRGRRAWRQAAVSVGAVVLPLVLPFVIWSPADFVEDVVRFPLGLGRERTAANAPTLGGWLVRTFPAARVAITICIVAVVAAVAGYLLFRARSAAPAQAAGWAGVVMLVAVVLAPAGRVGYLVYPVNLVAWSWLLSGKPRRGADDEGGPGARYALAHG